VLYADRVTGSMQRAMDETDRRRARQVAHNELHGITPQTVLRGVSDIVGDSEDAQKINTPSGQLKKKYLEAAESEQEPFIGGDNIIAVLADLEKRMFEAAENLEFEEAARLRDEMTKLKGA